MRKIFLYCTCMLCFLALGCSSDNDEEAAVASKEIKRFVGEWVMTQHRDLKSDNPYARDWGPYGTLGEYYLHVDASYNCELLIVPYYPKTGKLSVDAYRGFYINNELLYFYRWEGSGVLILEEGSREYKFEKQ